MDPISHNRGSVLQEIALAGGALGVSGLPQAQASAAGPPGLSTGAPTQLQDIGGVRLAYRRFGKAGSTPVVCVQHFVGTMNNWDPIHVTRLAQDREVILVDYRGVGRSEGQTPDSVEALAADIIAFIRALELARIDIFGFSLGGFVAQQIALDAPALVRRLILAGTGPSGGEGMASFSPQVKEIIASPNASTDERRLALFFSPSEKSQAAGKAWVTRISARRDDREPEPGPQVAPAQLVAITRWGGPSRVSATPRWLASPSRRWSSTGTTTSWCRR